MKAAILLVGEREETLWTSILRRTLSPFGVLSTVEQEEALRAVAAVRYDLVIVDAGAVEDVRSMVARLLARRRETRLVVATASPTWQRAREALQAGAMDYIPKSLGQEELRSRIRAVLEVELPPQRN